MIAPVVDGLNFGRVKSGSVTKDGFETTVTFSFFIPGDADDSAAAVEWLLDRMTPGDSH